jgi:hypothetical protein
MKGIENEILDENTKASIQFTKSDKINEIVLPVYDLDNSSWKSTFYEIF